jgi:hypothetical protein
LWPLLPVLVIQAEEDEPDDEEEAITGALFMLAALTFAVLNQSIM